MNATIDINTLPLSSGAHADPSQGMCVMEAVAYVAGERFSDRPQCASPVLGDFLRAWNDAMSDEDRQQLKPFIPRLVGTAASPAIEEQRQWMLLDWWCRVSAPTWLRLVKLEAEAAAVESTPPIVDKATAKVAIEALARAATAARAARAAAWAAAWDAAWDAARDAAWDAARDAAWDAARDAAWAAAWAALRPTVVALQASALELLDRMIALSEVSA